MLACCPLSSRVCQRESERERSRLCEGTCLLERKKKLLFCSLRHRQTCFCNTGTSIQPNKDLSYRQSFNSLKELILLFSSSGYLFFWNTISKKSFSFTLYLSFSPFATHWCLVCQFHYRASSQGHATNRPFSPGSLSPGELNHLPVSRTRFLPL